MPHLILIRHGQSEWNLEKKFTGWVNRFYGFDQELFQKNFYSYKSHNYNLGKNFYTSRILTTTKTNTIIGIDLYGLIVYDNLSVNKDSHLNKCLDSQKDLALTLKSKYKKKFPNLSIDNIRDREISLMDYKTGIATYIIFRCSKIGFEDNYKFLKNNKLMLYRKNILIFSNKDLKLAIYEKINKHWNNLYPDRDID